jgi:beta-lactam-binding protein with PASTA domain/tRNA A-37 threonylcarbamoyl transferase component Bud32
MSPNEPPSVYNGRYELVRLVARGGMAEVYLARDLLLDRPVALKVLFPELSVDRTFVARFRREAQAAANLSHPNIVPIYDWGESDRTYFIVMEYIDGRPLSNLLRADGPMPADQAAAVGAEVAAALGYAHRQGVIHRDVKPGNVLIANDGTVKVADFGIARAKADESLTQTGAVMGTATYFSPEQAQGENVDSRSDVYSLGVVLYEAVSGKPPFSGDNPLAIAYKHVREEPARLTGLDPEVPDAFEAIVFHALTKDPAQRYQTAEQLRADLLRFRYGRTVDAPALAPVSGFAATEVVDAGPAGAVAAGAVAAGAVAAGALAAGAVAAGAVPGGVGAGEWAGGAGGAAAGAAGGAYPAARAEGPVTTVLAPTDLAPTDDHTNATVANPRVGPEHAYASRYDRDLPYDPDQPVERRPRTWLWALLFVVLLIALAVVGYLILRSTGLLAKHHNTTSTTVPAVSVPSVLNEPYSTAKAQLTQDGFQVKESMTQSSQAVGTVTAQSATGTAPKGSTITLTVSSGPPTVQVPDVRGDNAAQAGALIQKDMLTVGTTSTAPSATVPANEVISTSPSANTPVAPNTPINLTISSGQPTSLVPPVIGDLASTAEQILTSAGFKVAPLSSAQLNDTVLTETPNANTTQPQGTTITLTVSTTTTTTIPNTSTTTPNTSTTTTTSPATTTTTAGGGGGPLGLLGG